MGFFDSLFATNTPVCPYCDAPAADVVEERSVEQSPGLTSLFALAGFASIYYWYAQTGIFARDPGAGCLFAVPMAIPAAVAALIACIPGAFIDRILTSTRIIPNECRRCKGQWGRVVGLPLAGMKRRLDNANHFFERGAHKEALHQLDRIVEVGRCFNLPTNTEGFGSLHLTRALCHMNLHDYAAARDAGHAALALVSAGSVEEAKVREYLVVIDEALTRRSIAVDWGMVQKDFAELLVSGVMRAMHEWAGAKDPRYVRLPAPDAPAGRPAAPRPASRPDSGGAKKSFKYEEFL